MWLGPHDGCGLRASIGPRTRAARPLIARAVLAHRGPHAAAQRGMHRRPELSAGPWVGSTSTSTRRRQQFALQFSDHAGPGRRVSTRGGAQARPSGRSCFPRVLAAKQLASVTCDLVHSLLGTRVCDCAQPLPAVPSLVNPHSRVPPALAGDWPRSHARGEEGRRKGQAEQGRAQGCTSAVLGLAQCSAPAPGLVPERGLRLCCGDHSDCR